MNPPRGLWEGIARATDGSLGQGGVSRLVDEALEPLAKTQLAQWIMGLKAPGAPRSLEEYSWVERQLATRPVTYERTRDLNIREPEKITMGFITDERGKKIHVIERTHVDEDRKNAELGAYTLQKYSPHTTIAPATVMIGPDRMLQERAGWPVLDRAVELDRKLFPGVESPIDRDFSDMPHWLRAYEQVKNIQNSPSFRWLMTKPDFEHQLQQSIVQRMVGGDADIHVSNIGLIMRKEGLAMGNFDWHLVEDTRLPSYAMLPPFSGRPIHKDILGDVRTYFDKLRSPDGKQILDEARINGAKESNLFDRYDWILTHEKFPDQPGVYHPRPRKQRRGPRD